MERKREKFNLLALHSGSVPRNLKLENLSYAHNLRMTDLGGIKSVCSHMLLESIATENEYSVRFEHSAAHKGLYIAVKSNEVHRVEIVFGAVVSMEVIYTYPDAFDSDYCWEFFAYGNMLYISLVKEKEIISEVVYQWVRDHYMARDLDSVAPPCTSDVECKYVSTTGVVPDIPALIVLAKVAGTGIADGNAKVLEYDYRYKSDIDTFAKSNYIHGTIYLIYAYKLTDGSIVKHSSINMIESSDTDTSYSTSLCYRIIGDKVYFYMKLSSVMPRLEFEVPQDVEDNPLIESIVIYSSRNNMIYNFDAIYETLDFDDLIQQDVTVSNSTLTTISARSLINKSAVEVAHSPFYQIAELNFRKDSSIELNQREHYDNIALKPIFQPNMSLHKLIGLKKFEYNSRLHLLGVKTNFFEGEIIAPSSAFITAKENVMYVKTDIEGTLIYKTIIEDNREQLSSYTEQSYCPYTPVFGNDLHIILPNILTFPDVRAKTIEVYFRSDTSVLYYINKFDLTKAPENGCAYYQESIVDNPMLYLVYPLANITNINIDNTLSTITYTNRIAVSEVNNGFVFNYVNIIDVDSSSTEINGVDTIYHNFAETTFGLYPLYVFTNRGVFALENQGDNRAYSSIVTVNGQITNSEFSSVPAVGLLYFLTDKGLFSIRGNSVEYVSAAIEQYKYAGQYFVDYLRGAKLLYSPFYDELIIYNTNYAFCYLYSIAKGQFTTRDFDFNVLGRDKLINSKGVFGLNYPEQALEPLHSYLETNPSGFGFYQRKTITSFEIAGVFKNYSMLKLYGSNDAVYWNEIKCINAYEARFKRALGSWRYLKFSVESDYIEIDTVEIEVQLKNY